LASLKTHLHARTEKSHASVPKFTREEIKSLPPSEIIEVLIKLRYIKAQHRGALLKMLDEGNTKIWNFFDVFFSSTKGHNLALATLYATEPFALFILALFVCVFTRLQRRKPAAPYFRRHCGARQRSICARHGCSWCAFLSCVCSVC